MSLENPPKPIWAADPPQERGENSPLSQAVAAIVKRREEVRKAPSTTKTMLQQQLDQDLKQFQDLLDGMQEKLDKSLHERWLGLKACAEARIASDPEEAGKKRADAEKHFAQTINVGNKFAHWIVEDALNDELPPQRETVVLVGDAHNNGVCFNFHVAFIPVNDAMVVTPDWWRIGLVEFPNESFVQATQAALRAVLERPGRLRWWLSNVPNRPPIPRKISGKSAQAAAAVAGLATLKTDAGPHPLLDPVTSITAALNVPAKVTDPASITLSPLEAGEGSLQRKIDGAIDCGLHVLFFAADQDLSKLDHTKDAQSPQEVFITHKVNNLHEALECMLKVSTAERNYKANVRAEWEEEWDDRATPAEYRR